LRNRVGISGLGRLYRLHESRLSEFEQVVEGLEEMIVVIDRNYRYLIANRAFLQYRNMKPEEVIGRHAREILDPEVFEKVIKGRLDECLRGNAVHFEMSYRYPDRGERQLLVNYLPIHGPGGVDRAACVLRDVTDEKRADHSLRLFRTLIDQSNDMVEVVDPGNSALPRSSR
jgi:PAS domain S-box-containing protein